MNELLFKSAVLWQSVAAVLVCIASISAYSEPNGDKRSQMPAALRTEGLFRIRITDNAKLRRFDVTVTSLTKRMLCVSRGDWPDKKGWVQGASQWVSIESDGSWIKARDPDLVLDCVVAECSLRIESHKELKGFIDYDVFGQPDQIAALQNKRLHFRPTIYLCPKGS